MHPSRLKALETIRTFNAQFDAEKGTEKGGEKAHQKTSEIYGSFNLKEMQKRLPREAFEAIKATIQDGHTLDPKLANTVADAVKTWALSHGCTHFTHWFQPLTGLTAEKHDSFISYDNDGGVIEKFSAGQLIQSEPDASSFPSGGMRSTFEARGYTAWDVSSPIFIRTHGTAKVLFIPSVFVSYTGHTLDTKTCLLRSIDVLNKAAVSMLGEMGDAKVKRVWTTMGPEQEYFLIDKNYASLRPDLLLAGRTLLGGDMPKGQQLEDHYFGAIPTRVHAFMVDMETELYRLGIPVKTRHNEVAPAQFELAPIFEDANLAADHNMLTMEILRKVADKHGFVCMLHEKPFAGINGSGKHCNWSMSTDTGENLLEPGKTPHNNVRFLAVLACTLRAVFKHQVALRAAIATHGNDHRLGANEAPPAIISAFLGSTLTQILETLEGGKDLSQLSAEKAFIEFGINRLPSLPKDNTDRNRTSPFAFTGNKFEFRAVGSSQAISFPVAMINAAVAESLNDFTAELKKKKVGATSVDSAVLEVARSFLVESKAIRFEGDGYSNEWRVEAKKRGLFEILKTPESWATFAKKEHNEFLVKQGVYRGEEIDALVHVRLEQYIKNLDIEAQTLTMLVRQYVLPAVVEYDNFASKSSLNFARQTHSEIAALAETAFNGLSKLQNELKAAHDEGDVFKTAKRFGDTVTVLMGEVRAACDKIESLVPDEIWPLPKYREMLFLR